MLNFPFLCLSTFSEIFDPIALRKAKNVFAILSTIRSVRIMYKLTTLRCEDLSGNLVASQSGLMTRNNHKYLGGNC